MKPAISLTLLAGLLVSAVPVGAQEALNTPGSAAPRPSGERDVLAIAQQHKNKGLGALIGLAVGGGLSLANVARWCPSRSDSCGNAGGASILFAGLGGAVGVAVAQSTGGCCTSLLS